MKTFASFLIALALLLSSSSQGAGLLIEPYVGYGMSTLSAKLKSDGSTIKTENNGLGFGGRLGYVFVGGLWLAGEYTAATEQDLKYKEPSGTADQKITASAAYLDLGFDVAMIPLRFWVGYGFMDNATIKTPSSSTDYTGTGYKIGLGFKPIPMVSINAEYAMHMHNKYKSSGGTEGDVSNVYDDYKADTIFISVSIPFQPMGK